MRVTALLIAQKKNINLYPKPANGIVNLTSDNVLAWNSYSIIDLPGRLITSSILTANLSVDVTHIAAGNYQLIIDDSEKKFLKHLTVQHY
jgi:hypothetical protein